MEGESHCSFFNTPQAVVSAQAWGEKKEKEKENQKGIFSRNLLAPEGRIHRITWPNTLHCDPGTLFSSPASQAYQRAKSTLCLAHRFAHKVKRKCQLRSRCPAPQQEVEELLSWLCWTTCQELIISLLNVWSTLLTLVLSHSMFVIHRSCSVCLFLLDIYAAPESFPSALLSFRVI